MMNLDLDLSSEFAIYFVPGDDASQAICHHITNAKKKILCQAYTFTDKDIANAFVAAKQRGCDVKIILDHGAHTGTNELGQYCKQQGLDVYLDAKHHISHNKVIIIDDSLLITGSFNFTVDAQKHNAENNIHILNKDVAKKYTDNWNLHFGHSEKWN